MTTPWKCSVADFDVPNAVPIGAGALSTVLRATHRATGALVAVKVLSKVQLLQMGKVQAVMGEKEALYELGPHPFIARLLGTAQTDDELYFVLEHLPHGDLLQHIRTVHADRLQERKKRQPAEAALVGDNSTMGSQTSSSPSAPQSPPCLDFGDMQLILAQIVMALSRCIDKGYVLRDLKPENVCFDAQYRCCLIDFDTAVKEEPTTLPHTNHGKPIRHSSAKTSPGRRKTVTEIQGMRQMTSQFCGTAQYVSPEMVGECSWSYSSDLWALGVIAYQCLYGVYPFKGSNTFSVMKKLVCGLRPEKHFATKIAFDDEVEGHTSTSPSSSPSRFDRIVSFISSLLRVDPTLRLGVNPITLRFDVDMLRGHAFFEGFDWSIMDKEIASYTFPGALDTLRKQVVASSSSTSNNHTISSDSDRVTSSISQLLRTLPTHSDDYASYVCKASNNDSNPFEAWAHRYDDTNAVDANDVSIRVQDGAAEPPAVDHNEGGSSDDEYYANHTARHRAAPDPITGGSDDEDDEDEDSDDDVEDDVGMQAMGQTDRDFQH